jgi:ferric-dicitrate binding protein FerR (iron transport regulator)
MFRARYASLAEAAKGHLKDAQSAAPRIVEALFLRAWDERAQFKSPEELDAFLNDEVAHAAARELARRASAHHFGGGHNAHAAAHAEPSMNVDQSWERVHHALHPDRAATAGAVKEASRHEAASHVKGLAKKRNYVVPVVIILLAIAAALGISKYLNRLGREGGIVQALATAYKTAPQTHDAQLANTHLPDGSPVKVGPNSKLVTADNFGDEMRVIQVEGAAAVSVAGGHPTPLEVRAFNAVVDAPGGSVAVRTYAGDSSVTVVSLSGDDSLRVGTDLRALPSGAALHVAHDGQVRDATPGERAEASTWVNDTLTIADRPLKTAIDEIRSWYGTKIVVLDTLLLKRPISATAPLNSSLAAIAAVEKSGQVKFGYEGQAMVFRDAAKK